jgi:hypothetical protein
MMEELESFLLMDVVRTPPPDGAVGNMRWVVCFCRSFCRNEFCSLFAPDTRGKKTDQLLRASEKLVRCVASCWFLCLMIVVAFWPFAEDAVEGEKLGCLKRSLNLFLFFNRLSCTMWTSCRTLSTSSLVSCALLLVVARASAIPKGNFLTPLRFTYCAHFQQC